MTNESILISEVIPATPQRIFSAWMDSAEHSAFTGDEATVVPKVGGEHRAANGYIQGRTLELAEGSRIVQSWRTSEFPPESPDSRVEITLEPTLGGTLVTLLHTDIPVGQGDRYRQSWNEYYLSRLKTYFSDTDGNDRTESTLAPASDDDAATGLDIELDEETAVGDFEPTSVAEAPTKVMRTNVKRALAAAASREQAAPDILDDAQTTRLHSKSTATGRARSATASLGKAKAARPSAKPASKKAAVKAAARKPGKATLQASSKKASKASKPRRPAKASVKAAARRPAKAAKKVTAKASRKPTRKPAKKLATTARGKRPAGKRKGGSKR